MEAQFKELKVKLTATRLVPADFKITSTNYAAFSVAHTDDGGEVRALTVREATVSTKPIKITPATESQ